MEMDMYKDSRWSKEILSLQNEEGLWGYFHTLSDPKKHPITTEQALRRLQVLGYTIDDVCIQKAVQYMHDSTFRIEQLINKISAGIPYTVN
jgi:hypothetical protein